MDFPFFVFVKSVYFETLKPPLKLLNSLLFPETTVNLSLNYVCIQLFPSGLMLCLHTQGLDLSVPNKSEASLPVLPTGSEASGLFGTDKASS